MKLVVVTMMTAGALALAACGEKRTDDVVQAPVEGGVAMEMPVMQAETAASEAAVALGMTRAQLEDADLVSATGVKLGDIETLVVDAAGKVTHMVVELEGPSDVKIQLPADKVRAYTAPNRNDRDLTTDLTSAQLASQPRWDMKPR